MKRNRTDESARRWAGQYAVTVVSDVRTPLASLEAAESQARYWLGAAWLAGYESRRISEMRKAAKKRKVSK